MVTTLRRGKILDTALSAFCLIIFGVIPIALLLSQDSRRFRDETIQTAYTAVLVLSWPFFSLAGFLLLYFWRKDRAVDKVYFSTATPRQLSVISAALVSHAIGCLLLSVGILLSTINRFQQQHSKFFVVLDIIAIILVLWIGYTVVSVIFDVRRSKESVQDFDQNQTFAEARHPQSISERLEATEGFRPRPNERSEPTFV